jgi:hypothetical protein
MTLPDPGVSRAVRRMPSFEDRLRDRSPRSRNTGSPGVASAACLHGPWGESYPEEYEPCRRPAARERAEGTRAAILRAFYRGKGTVAERSSSSPRSDLPAPD